MARPLALFSGPWADVPLDDLARKAREFGYRALELAVGGPHLTLEEVADPAALAKVRTTLEKHDLLPAAVNGQALGQALLDTLDQRHKAILPASVWGDGQPASVSRRAADELKNMARAAQRLSVDMVAAYTGSTLWPLLAGYPPATKKQFDASFDLLAERLNPVLDVFGECGVRFALRVAPGQPAFDVPSAERTLAALDQRDEFGFAVDPAQLLWQGVEPVEFLRAFPERIFHVYAADATVLLDGRTSILVGGAGPSSPFDRRAGWQHRSPGHGRVDWEELFRALAEIDYDGSLSVDWSDPLIDRDHGARESSDFLTRCDFPLRPRG